MRRKLMIPCLLFFAVLTATGCGTEEQSATAAAEKNEIDTGKWNTYVELSNKSQSVMRLLSAYAERFGREAEPAVAEKDVSYFAQRAGEGMRFMNTFNEDLAARVLKQAETKPLTDLDPKAAAFVQSAGKLWADVTEAQKYYQSKAHLDDELARGRELHTRIMAGYDELEPAYQNFSMAMDERNRLMMAADVQRMRKDGLKITPAALDCLIAAQAFSGEANRQAEAAGQAPLALDVAALKPFYDRLTEAVKTLDEVEPEKAQREKEKLSADRLNTVADNARKIRGQAADLMAAPGQTEPPARKDDQRKLLESLDRNLNLMVNAYNRML